MIKPTLIKYSLQNIYKRRTRSWLTVVSVLIGIAAITTLISFGYGLSFYVSDMAQKMGTDKLIVMGKGMSATGESIFDKTDIDVIKKTSGVEEVVGLYVVSAEVEYNNQKKYAYLAGADMKGHRALMEELLTVKIFAGEALKGDERLKATFGYNYMIPDKIFSKGVEVGDKIKVNGQDLTVLGFYGSIGSPQDDSNIYITDIAAEEIFGLNKINEIFVRSSPGENTTKLADDIAKDLRTHRNQKKGNEDFFVQTFEQVIATFGTILNIIVAVVILIAAISVLVGSVNIANTMYASIIERTKEIGIFKAIGAKNSEILLIFVMESGLLSLVGGIIGFVIGFLLAQGAGMIISAAGYGFLKPYFSWLLVVQIISFAFLVGIAAGILPARNASKLRPVEALRYE